MAGRLTWALLFASFHPGSALATPRATFEARALPIPGFKGTGNVLGAGTDVEIHVTITGTEYGGFPSPLVGLHIYAPLGFKVTPGGFATCPPSTLQARGPTGCPRGSSAGPQGTGLGFVSFGDEAVPEKVAIQSFFARDGLTFYVEGHTPALFDMLERAYWVTAKAPYGPEMIVEVPLIETLPGADDASVTSFRVEIGAAYRRGKRAFSYLTQPKKCPRNGFPAKLELSFLSGETVTVSTAAPCPRRARSQGRSQHSGASR